MKLNHLDPTVTEGPAVAEFLADSFGFVNHPGGSAGMALLTDTENDDGMIITQMKGIVSILSHPHNLHVGFFIESYEETDVVNARKPVDRFESMTWRTQVIPT